jgi:hypothetical protein
MESKKKAGKRRSRSSRERVNKRKKIRKRGGGEKQGK